VKRKTKPRRVSKPRTRKPAPVPALPPETANLPAVASRADYIPTTNEKVRALVSSKNFYEIAAGMSRTTIPQLALISELPAETALRWISLCPTPKRFRWWRPGPGASKSVCGDGGTCRTCPQETFDACRFRLEYVPGSFMIACADMMFPGRWSNKDMKGQLLTGGKETIYVVSGYLVIKHKDGTTQEVYATGQCTVRANLGHAMKGAETDFIKKALSRLGFCADVYSGLGMHEDIPPETGDKPAPPTPDARKVWAALFGDVDKRLRTDPRSVHKSGYSPRLKWEDAANLWPEWGESQAPFASDDEAVECFAALPVEQRKALYAKIRYKWIRGDKALMDAKYGRTEAPDDYRPDEAKRSPVEPDPSQPRKSKQGDVAAPKFKLWAQQVLKAKSWRDAEPEINRVVKLYAERQKRTDLADWLDLTPVDAQNIRALLQEEAAKGGKS